MLLNYTRLLKKIRCTLRHFIPLSNLFPSLARRFACCQSCSVSLRTLWAYPHAPHWVSLWHHFRIHIYRISQRMRKLIEGLFGFYHICLSALPAQAGVAQVGEFSFKVITDLGHS